MRSLLLLIPILVGLAGRAWADPAVPVMVATVIDGRTLSLADGTVVRLAGIDIPAGRRRAMAADALRTLLQGRAILVEGLGPVDRHGRLPGLIQRDDDADPVSDLVRQGLARVDAGDAMPTAMLGVLLEEEAEARTQGVGLWADPAFAVRAADGLGRDALDRFQIVEGRVLKAAVVRRRIYLNFGTDYARDFTVTIEPQVAARAAAARQNPQDLEGHRVRVRGWLDWSGGPRIAIDRIEQIERLD